MYIADERILFEYWHVAQIFLPMLSLSIPCEFYADILSETVYFVTWKLCYSKIYSNSIIAYHMVEYFGDFIHIWRHIQSSKYHNSIFWNNHWYCKHSILLLHFDMSCRKAMNHYINQWWTSSMMPYGVPRQQWSKTIRCWVLYLLRSTAVTQHTCINLRATKIAE